MLRCPSARAWTAAFSRRWRCFLASTLLQYVLAFGAPYLVAHNGDSFLPLFNEQVRDHDGGKDRTILPGLISESGRLDPDIPYAPLSAQIRRR